MNEKQITDKNIKEYFRKGVINDYKEFFLNYASKETIDDPNQYPEFKKLYKNLTDDRSISASTNIKRNLINFRRGGNKTET